MKRKAEGEPGSPTTKKNLQFIGVNGGYVCMQTIKLTFSCMAQKYLYSYKTDYKL